MLHQFYIDLQKTTLLEYIAVFAGVLSVWFSKKENILVYPIGLINTILYTYLCIKCWELYAEGTVNFYYSIMGIYGWYCWKKELNKKEISITKNDKNDWIKAISFFAVSFILLFVILKKYTDSSVPFVDAFASATAYTAMWQMTKKKLEHWLWWIATNIISIPLYIYKHTAFTAFQYTVFLIIAVLGFLEWRKKYARTI